MCYTEDSLLTTADSDFKLKKKLYEKMGDGACELKIFDKAIDYYKKMLEYAELNGESEKDLIPVYVSLAQTYKDNKEYDLAAEYFQKEYELSFNNPKESCSTLLNIAELYLLSEKKYEEIAKMYEKARLVARETREMKIEGKVITRFINAQKKFGKIEEAAALEKELLMMNYVESDSDSEEEIESGTPNIGEDINISDISNDSDNSNTEETDNVRRTRRRNTGFIIKKNSKGETPLHTACIAGNLTLVRRLVDQGHLINIRDNCGWLPIHEACICGHKEIVELLVEKGANINDRGGALCNGMTPLHDACCNGHLEIIEYLLEHGASVLSQTDNGETPLDILKQWRQRTDLNAINQTYYETIVSKMTYGLEKAGKNVSKDNISKDKKSSQKPYKIVSTPKKLRNSDTINQYEISPSYKEKLFKSFSSEDLSIDRKTKISPNLNSSKARLRSSRSSLDSEDSSSSSKNKINSPKGKPVGTLRHIIDNGSSDEEPYTYSKRSKERLKQRASEVTSSLEIIENTQNIETSSNDDSTSDVENSARNEYKQVMQNLRNRHSLDKLNKPSGCSQTKRSAIVTINDDVGDSWLEDDLKVNQPTKKRKFGSIIKQNFIETSHSRKSNSPLKFNSRRSSSNSVSDNKISDEKIFFNDQNMEIVDIDEDSNDSFSSNTSNKKRKTQLSLLNSGFSRKLTTPEKQSRSSFNCSFNKAHRRQPKISSFTVPNDILEPDSTTSSAEILPLTPLTRTIQTLGRAMYAITVRIENKLWRIPIPASDVPDLNIGWLANEAAKRYYRLVKVKKNSNRR